MQNPITWYVIKTKLGSLDASGGPGPDGEYPMGAIMSRLKRMKFVMHRMPPAEFVAEGEERQEFTSDQYMPHFNKLYMDIKKAFESLSE